MQQQPMEDIFEGEVEQANLKLPFWKLFTKPPVNETAPIPTPKEGLDNPTSEILIEWIWNKLKPRLERLVKLVLWENEVSRVEFKGN